MYEWMGDVDEDEDEWLSVGVIELVNDWVHYSSSSYHRDIISYHHHHPLYQFYHHHIETTIWSSSFRIPADKSIVANYVTTGVPVGHPISATTFILITEDGKEVTASDGEGEC